MFLTPFFHGGGALSAPLDPLSPCPPPCQRAGGAAAPSLPAPLHLWLISEDDAYNAPQLKEAA